MQLKFYKQKLREGLNKVQDFVADPKVTNVAKITRGALDIAAKVAAAKAKGPVAIVGAAVGTLSVIQEVLEPTRPDRGALWIKENKVNAGDLVGRQSVVPRFVVSTGLLEALSPKEVVRDGTCRLMMVQDVSGRRFVMKLIGDNGVSDICYVDKDFDFEAIGSAIWQGLHTKTVKLVVGTASTGHRVEALDHDDFPYTGEISPEEFIRETEIFRSRGISRAHLLEGVPGTGKTSFVRVVARITGKSLLILPHTALSCPSVIEESIRVLRPDITLFDDLDRNQPYISSTMGVIDDVRRTMPNVLIIATINQLTKMNAAVLRPGRMGARRIFCPPDTVGKEELLRLYMERYGVDPSGFDVPALVALMGHKRFSHDYVRFVAEEAVVKTTQKSLEAVIQGLIQVLDISEYMEPSAPAAAPAKLSDLVVAGEAALARKG